MRMYVGGTKHRWKWPWTPPDHWDPGAREGWGLLHMFLPVGVFAILPAAIVNYFAPGVPTLGVIAVGTVLIMVRVYVHPKAYHVYYHELISSLKRFILGAVISFVFVLPYVIYLK